MRRFQVLFVSEERLLAVVSNEARSWFNVGSANGSDQGSKNRDSIAKRMTPEQIAEAQKLSKVWFELYQPKK
jgi:hypothetical protein